MNVGSDVAEERYLTFQAKVKHVDNEAWRRHTVTTPEPDRTRTSVIGSWFSRLRQLRHPWTRLPQAESHG
jgi:hypothetical protein